MMEDFATAPAETSQVCSESGKKERKSHVWARDGLDFYTEPAWCSERLFAVERFEGRIHDPAAGSGTIIVSAMKAGLSTTCSDIFDHSFGCDYYKNFLSGRFSNCDLPRPFDNIVCNPPFRHAKEFVQLSLERAERKVAMLLPLQWLAGDARSRWLDKTPLRRVLVLSPRPSMPPGDAIARGIKPTGGKADFCWFIFHRGYDGKPELGWCRRDA